MNSTLTSWIQAAQDLVSLNDRSFRSLQSELSKQQVGISGNDLLKRNPEESVSAEALYQRLFDTYDDALIAGYFDLRSRCLALGATSILLFPARTLFEMATRKAPRVFSESERPRKICLTTDFSALAFSGALGYSREEFLGVLERIVEDPELPKSYTVVLYQLIDAVEEDDKHLFDQLLIDLRRAEATGLRKEQVNEAWLWEAPRDLMFSNISHLVHGNPFTVMHLDKEDLALWRYYAVLLQSDHYLLKLCESIVKDMPMLVTPSQEKAYRRLQDESNRVIASLK